MLIKYFNEKLNTFNTYNINNDFNCELFALLFETKEFEVELFEFEDIFKDIIEEKEFEYKDDEGIDYIIKGLSYFGCERLWDFILSVKYEITKEIRKDVGKQFEEVIEELLINDYDDGVKFRIWVNLVKNPLLSKEFYNTYIYNVSNFISFNSDIDISFFINHPDKIRWDILCSNTNIPVDFFQQHIDQTNWEELCFNKNIPVEFFERNIERITERGWAVLSANENIPMAFYEKYKNKLNWTSISRNKGITVEFLEQNIDRDLDWNYITQNPNMTSNFFEKHVNRIVWRLLGRNENMPITFLNKHVDSHINTIRWDDLSRNESIPVDFFERYIHKVEPIGISLNKKIPVSFFENHIDKINWRALCMNKNIPVDFFIKHDKFSVYNLSQNENIPVHFLEDHIDEINWYYFLENNGIPVSFFKQHSNNEEIINGLEKLSKNDFDTYIKRTIENRLNKINPILNDKHVENNIIALYYLNVLSHKISKKSIDLLSENRGFNNALSYSKDRGLFELQIKHFLCRMKDITKYKKEILEICSAYTESSKPKLLSREDIYNLNNLDVIQITKNDRVLIITMKNNKIFLHENGITYPMKESELYQYIGLPANIIKSEENYSDVLNREEKRSLTKEIDYAKNSALNTIYTTIRKNINPNIRFDFKDFYDFYILNYKGRDPRHITKKEINSMIDDFQKFVSIKRHEKRNERKEIEEKKEEPVNPEIYELILIRDSNTTIEEFNNAYNLVFHLFDPDMTIEDMINLVYNHIVEIRNPMFEPI